jgi:riboflavin biosynthesis pyrimidine reductase
MIELTPLDTLYDAGRGDDLPLPIELARLYGSLRFPPHSQRPYVIGNFVSTLDGVVSLEVAGHAGGGDISGFNPHDQLVMGLLRSIADAVIVGAGTLRASPQILWIAEQTYRPLAEVYRSFRAALGKSKPPLNVIVTARGEIDLDLPVFQSGLVPVLIVTTTEGARQIRSQHPSSAIPIEAIDTAGSLSVRSILEAVGRVRSCEVILTEGGPRLMGDFLAEKQLDELFLTLAPQIAGRDDVTVRPGLVAGKIFAPYQAMWGTLSGIKQGGSHLFLRYSFESTAIAE